MLENARLLVDQYVLDNKGDHTELDSTHTKILYTSFTCSQELPTHQNLIKEHYEYLHGIRLNELGKIGKKECT